jgi:hypothetical protein
MSTGMPAGRRSKTSSFNEAEKLGAMTLSRTERQSYLLVSESSRGYFGRDLSPLRGTFIASIRNSASFTRWQHYFYMMYPRCMSQVAGVQCVDMSSHRACSSGSSRAHKMNWNHPV